MFRIKICGVTNLDDALAACDAGADAIGLNFCSASKRFIAPAVVREIVAGLPSGVESVGVFVNSSADNVIEIADFTGLRIVQLHGDEPPELLAEIADRIKRPIVRAFRCRNGSSNDPSSHPASDDPLEEVDAYLHRCRELGRLPAAVLLDAHAPGQYGGTGRTLDWTNLARHRDRLGGLRLILAGGLRPENVAEAIRIVHPEAVDTASGVESAPGHKDAQLMQRFAAAARDAFESSTAR